MRTPKLAGLLLFVGALLAYLMLVKRHGAAARPQAFVPPPQRRPGVTGVTATRSQYCIMFDAGSMGTRVHIIQFRMDPRGVLALDRERFKSIRPGLSDYADDPQQCAAGITELLQEAQASVPPSLWSSTPVVLKATAGLRLLPGEKAEHLLDTVRALFQKSPFLYRENDSVSIMNGVDEGIFAWITVNFLTGDLQHASSKVGILDLGGGSLQVTFSPQDETTIQMAPIDHISSFHLFNTTYTLYTHSYLGLGLMSARIDVLGGVHSSSLLPLGGSTELVSPCLAAEYSGSWEYGDVVYTVKGQRSGEPVYEACRSRVQQLLRGKLLAPSDAAAVDFFALGYFYLRAVDLGFIEGGAEGSVTLDEYTQAAKRVCSSSSVSPASPFLCLDIIYVCVLLEDLGFPPQKTFKLARTIQGVETSWALGAAFHHLT